MTAMPPDPLQTNYEYAANLAFTPANFTPYTKWVDGITASVRANPASVIDCAASGNSTACLQTEAKKFAARAFRGTLSDAQLARYADMLTTGVSQVGLPDAVADLVDVTLNSPNYVYRDEVLTDASAVLLPARAAAGDELHAGRRAAGDGRPFVGGAGRRARHAGRHGGDRRQAAGDARGAREADAVLHLVAGGAGARPSSRSRRRCSPSSRRRSPPRWSTRSRRS